MWYGYGYGVGDEGIDHGVSDLISVIYQLRSLVLCQRPDPRLRYRLESFVWVATRNVGVIILYACALVIYMNSD